MDITNYFKTSKISEKKLNILTRYYFYNKLVTVLVYCSCISLPNISFK